MNRYEEKKAQRVERLRRAAELYDKRAQSIEKSANDRSSCIPMGQPILVGHHSEKRDRNFREKIRRSYERAHQFSKKAEELRRRADAAERDRSISSDDPDAIRKLTIKLETYERGRERAKETNRLIRRALGKAAREPKRKLTELQLTTVSEVLKGQGRNEGEIRKCLSMANDYDPAGYPSWSLSNIGAEIRRLKTRIEQLRAREGRIAHADELHETTEGVVTLCEDVEDNRLRLIFPGKPSIESRTLLKQYGFRWSPTNGAWQRQLTGAARPAAEAFLMNIRKSETATG